MGPKEEQRAAIVRAKVRAASDADVEPWSPYCSIKQSQAITSEPSSEGKELRQLAAAEVVETIGVPKQADDKLWIKVRAQKDGIVGWLAAKDGDGKCVLEN